MIHLLTAAAAAAAAGRSKMAPPNGVIVAPKTRRPRARAWAMMRLSAAMTSSAVVP
jgi:hypothetical protein